MLLLFFGAALLLTTAGSAINQDCEVSEFSEIYEDVWRFEDAYFCGEVEVVVGQEIVYLTQVGAERDIDDVMILPVVTNTMAGEIRNSENRSFYVEGYVVPDRVCFLFAGPCLPIQFPVRLYVRELRSHNPE